MPKPSFRKNKSENDSQTTKHKEKIYVGSIRKTQLITTYGVGSIVDFKNDTVIIASVDDWDQNRNNLDEVESRKIFNENLSVITGAKYFLLPRTTPKVNAFSKFHNIPSYIFPEKQHCSRCGNIYDINELNINQRNKCPNCKNDLTASRFIVACENGHLDDFPYNWWVHNGKLCLSGKTEPRITMKNVYNRTDIGSLKLECTECGATRSMTQVFNKNSLSEYKCTCNNPHFSDSKSRVKYGCNKIMKAKLRSSSGVYFPITKSALLIPPWSKKVVQYIQKEYDILKEIPINVLPDKIRRKLNDNNLGDEDVIYSFEAVKRAVESKEVRTEYTVMKDEYNVLSKRENNSEESFSSYSADVPSKYKNCFKQISIIDRLTVTQALTGFTRIIKNESNKVDISQYKKEWLPAVELTGEGIFIKFNDDKVLAWNKLNSSHYDKMQYTKDKNHFNYDKFSSVYVMLHTFSHLFIREISNICGYSSASIREKIYCDIDNDKITMCGVLIYVSSSDSDSSLGGLISAADNTDLLEEILDSMIERAQWCSADPLCISSTQQGYKNLNYAACHDCTLLPENSCEIFNVFLDRGSIVGLTDKKDLGYFSEFCL